MNQETKNKMAEILAAAQSKVQSVNKTATKKVEQPVTIPAETEQTAPAKMVSFTILWHEGTNEYEGRTFTTWNTANDAMRRIYNSHEGAGYTKAKICVKWENGAEITDRADCSDSTEDFCAKRETIGEYLQRQTSVMCGSNLMQGDRVKLSFKDEVIQNEAAPETAFVSPLIVPDNANIIELSEITVNDLLNNTQDSNTAPLKIVDYSDKAFAVIGETKPIKDTLKALGGRFNMFLTCGAGWIFPKTKMNQVKLRLSL